MILIFYINIYNLKFFKINNWKILKIIFIFYNVNGRFIYGRFSLSYPIAKLIFHYLLFIILFYYIKIRVDLFSKKIIPRRLIIIIFYIYILYGLNIIIINKKKIHLSFLSFFIFHFRLTFAIYILKSYLQKSHYKKSYKFYHSKISNLISTNQSTTHCATHATIVNELKCKYTD